MILKPLAYLSYGVALSLAAIACGGGNAAHNAGNTAAPAAGSAVASSGTAGAKASVSPSAAKIRRGGTLTVVSDTDARGFDPMVRSDTYGGYLSDQVFEGLVRYGEDLVAAPALADSWDVSPDGKTYTFHLHKGVKFHDGTDYNAEAQKFSMDRIRTNKASIGYADCGDNIVLSTEAVDELTFRLTLNEPFTPFLTKLTGRCGAAVSLAAVKSKGDDEFGLHPIGTGAFKFFEWKKDDHFTVVKNENYWRMGADGKPLPYLDKVVFRVITDRSAGTQALITGDVDQLKVVNDKDVETIKGNKDLVFAQKPGFGWGTYVVNVSKPPFNNKALAQALAYATDRDEYIRVILKDLRPKAENGPIPPALGWAVDPSYKPYTYDPAQAKAKLAEGGFPNGGFSFTMLADTADPVTQQGLELLQAQYKRVGIDMKIESGSFNDVVLPRAKTGDFEAARTTVVGGIDPDTWVFNCFGSTGSLNRSHFSDPALDKLAQAGRTEGDMNKRAAIYKEAVPIIMDRSPWIMIYYDVDRFIGRKVIQNYAVGTTSPATYMEYWKSAD